MFRGVSSWFESGARPGRARNHAYSPCGPTVSKWALLDLAKTLININYAIHEKKYNSASQQLLQHIRFTENFAVDGL